MSFGPPTKKLKQVTIKGVLPPRTRADMNPDPRRGPPMLGDNEQPDEKDSMISTYPLLRRILQSRKLLSDSITLRGFPDQPGLFPVEVANPSLKYDFLEYLVEEENQAQAIIEGRDRGGRGRLIRDSDLPFSETAFVTLSKVEAKASIGSPSATATKDDWTRLRHQSIMSLGNRKTQFRPCPLHNEELVMYDKLNQKMLCCRCLAVMQLKPGYDTKEVVMADDYCLQWSLKWRDLSQKISYLKEILTNRATINGLLFSQIQNYAIKEVLHARFKPQDLDPSSSPLLIHQFAQRIYEAEQLALDYETIAAADSVHSMELSYHLFTEDFKKLNDLIKNTDLLRENLIVENVGRFIINQLDDADNSNGEASNEDSVRQLRVSTLRSLGGLGGGHESMRSTLDESPDVEEFETSNHFRKKSIMKSYNSGAPRPPISAAKKLSFTNLKSQPIKSTTKATVNSLSHARSTSALSQNKSIRGKNDRGCVSIGKSPKRAVDEDFWEDSKQSKNRTAVSTQMVDMLHNLSSLRIQLRQCSALADTLKHNAIQAELRGDAFKALELMSETHQQVLKMRGLEERITEAKKGISRLQKEQSQEVLQSRNQAIRLSQSNKYLTQSARSSTLRPFKYLKDVI